MPRPANLLGTNLEHIDDASRSYAWLNRLKLCRDPWFPQRESPNFAFNSGDPIILDANGWPQAVPVGDPGDNMRAVTIYKSGQGSNFPAGDWVLLFDGDGEYDMKSATTKTDDHENGRYVFTITESTSTVTLRLSAVGATVPYNIRLCQAEHESLMLAGERWHPTFKTRMKEYGFFRFMDWGHTNDSAVTAWADRTSEDYWTMAKSTGVAWEEQINLCNDLGRWGWFCIPHLADDEYVQSLAALIRDNLDPRLHCYVEYSNEVWNGIFDQATYANAQGAILWPTADAGQQNRRFYSQRSVEVFDLFAGVYGVDPLSPNEHYSRVLAFQSTNPVGGADVLDWNDAYLKADCLAIAPYWGNNLGTTDEATATKNGGLDYIFEECYKDMQSKMAQNVRVHALNAQQRGMRLIAYEGGSHLAGVGSAQNDSVLTDLLNTASQDPRMQELMTTYMMLWTRNGGEEFANFTNTWAPSKYGDWGTMLYDNQDPTTSYKYQALMAWKNSNFKLGPRSHGSPSTIQSLPRRKRRRLR